MAEIKMKKNNGKTLCGMVFVICTAMGMVCKADAATPPPLVMFEKGAVTITGGDANNNGKIDSIREGIFKVALKSSVYGFNKVYDVTAVVTTTNTNVIITSGASTYGDIDIGVTKSPTNAGFAFKLKNTSYSGTISFSMTVSYKDASGIAYTCIEPFTAAVTVERVLGTAVPTVIVQTALADPVSSSSGTGTPSATISATPPATVATSGDVDHIAIVDLSGMAVTGATLKGGDKLTMSSIAYDNSGNPVGEVVSDWQVNTDIGTVNSGLTGSAVFEALKRGTGYLTITDASGRSATTGLVNVTDSKEPVAIYRFDENSGSVANDESFNENNGTIIGALWSNGRVSAAVSFEDNGDLVNCGHGASLNIRNALTVMAWFMAADDCAVRTSAIVSKDGSKGYQLKLVKGSVNASLLINRVRYNVYGTAKIPSGEWHHLAATYDGAAIRVYLDGELEGAKSIRGRIDDSAEYDLIIGGAYSDSSSWRAAGAIDDVIIYDKALSQSEIASALSIPSSNNPPVLPSRPTGPTSGSTGNPYKFYTSAKDPESGQLKYVFDWDDGETSVTPYLDSENAAAASHAWEGPPGVYEIRVKAIDKTGAESPWSDPLRLGLTQNSGNQPKISLPVKSITVLAGKKGYVTLSGYGSDAEDSETDLAWSVKNVDTSFFQCSISKDSGTVRLNILPVSNKSGKNVITLVLTDKSGLTDTYDLILQQN